MRRFARYRPSPAMVIALLALAVALGGTGYAAVVLPKNSVGTAQLKNNAVIASKVKDGSLRAADFAAGQIPAGPVGPAGPAGAAGATGPAGPSDAYSAFHDAAVPTSSPEAVLATLTIPQAGKYVIIAKAWFSNSGAIVQMNCRLVSGANFDRSRFVLHAAPSGSQAVPFTVSTELAAAGVAQLLCDDSGGVVTANDIKITAIKVGNLTNAGV